MTRRRAREQLTIAVRGAGLALVMIGCTERPSGDTAGETTSTSSTTASTEVSTTSTTTATAGPTTATTATPTTTSATTGEPACEPYTVPVVIPVVTPYVVLVVDHSPVMNDPWDHDADPQTPAQPRWASVRAGLEAVLPKAAKEGMQLGVIGYPGATASAEYGPQACALEPGEFLAPAPDAADEVLAALPPADATLVGGAPLATALTGAIGLLQDVPEDSPRGFLLITAGAPNCAPGESDPNALLEGLDASVAPLLVEAQQSGLWVGFLGVGVDPDAGPSPVLADMRPDAVDVAAYLDGIGLTVLNVADDEAELIGQLDWNLVGESESTCWLSITPPPGADQFVAEVRIAGAVVPGPVEDCRSESGWQLAAPDAITLCGTACTAFGEQGDLEIDVACKI